MLVFLAFLMVATFMTLIMTKRLSALMALILVPIVFAVIAGFGAGLGDMMLAGVRELAPTGVMLLFAILYFGIMIDAGLFDPLIKAIVKLVHGDPLRICVGTAVMTLIVALDGDGTTTYMITVSALLPLYRHMKMDIRIMACLIMMSVGVMNVVPWGGPTTRAALALGVDSRELFVSLIPAMAVTALWVLASAWMFGLRERKRLATLSAGAVDQDATGSDIILEQLDGGEHRRPRLYWFNLALTLALLALLMAGSIPLVILFMGAFAIAATVNYPNVQQQKDRVAAHAANAMATVSLVFGAGIFIGILSGTGMVDAMAGSVVAVIPAEFGPYMAPITAFLSMPFTFLISNDAFYFGMLPVLAKTAAEYGLSPMEIARASLVGQQIHLLSPLVASTYLLVGMSGIELADHQKFMFRWAVAACFIFLTTCLLCGLFPLRAG